MANQINFVVIGQSDNRVQFRIKTCTSMRWVIDSYKDKFGLIQNVTLTIDSNEITIFDTPKTLAMDNEDVIFAFDAKRGSIDIKVKHQNKTGFMRVYPKTTISILINLFIDKYDINLCHNMRLKFGDHVCKDDETMQDLGLKTGDTLHDFD
uniref:Rad60/SUMO-like domain-containing protein n=1 Tax=viral metagenome TaxID=1070528 RepID=A0A6C0C984_9ZZZZ